jgi:Arc/MetJ-type ribon-helix-helix transcriptional regulator
MTLTVRLPDELETQLREKLEAEDIKASDFVRAAIAEKLAREPVKKKKKLSPYDLGKHLFGKYDLGDPDMSTNRKALIAEYLDAKHARRQRTAGGSVQQDGPVSDDINRVRSSRKR